MPILFTDEPSIEIGLIILSHIKELVNTFFKKNKINFARCIFFTNKHKNQVYVLIIKGSFMASIFFRIIIVFTLLSIAMRVMGKREIGELEVGELITTLLISEISSIPIEDPNIPLMNAIIPVLFVVSAEIIISFIKNKSTRLKKLFGGESVFLIYQGNFRQEILIENRLSLEEFMTAMRQNGIGRIEDIEYCVLEANGKISMIEKDDGGGLSHIIISDGEVDIQTLKMLGMEEKWLFSKIKPHKPEQVFLLTVNDNLETYIILKEEKK